MLDFSSFCEVKSFWIVYLSIIHQPMKIASRNMTKNIPFLYNYTPAFLSFFSRPVLLRFRPFFSFVLLSSVDMATRERQESKQKGNQFFLRSSNKYSTLRGKTDKLEEPVNRELNVTRSWNFIYIVNLAWFICWMSFELICIFYDLKAPLLENR